MAKAINRQELVIDVETLSDDTDGLLTANRENRIFAVHPKSSEKLNALFEAFDYGFIDDFIVTEKGEVRYIFRRHPYHSISQITTIPHQDVYSITKLIRAGYVIAAIENGFLKLGLPAEE